MHAVIRRNVHAPVQPAGGRERYGASASARTTRNDKNPKEAKLLLPSFAQQLHILVR